MEFFVQSTGFDLDGYRIPPFTLGPSEMVRIWIPPTSKKGGWTGYDMSKHFTQALAKKRYIQGLTVNQPIPFAQITPQRPIASFLYPLTVERFLKQRQQLNEMESQSLTTDLGLTGKKKMEQLNSMTSRLLSIQCMAIKSCCLAFDYFGVDPTGEQAITEFMKRLIEAGR
ncbi:MAG: hypothetical protein V4714_13165 [Bacteroidota bacterium]